VGYYQVRCPWKSREAAIVKINDRKGLRFLSKVCKLWFYRCCQSWDASQFAAGGSKLASLNFCPNLPGSSAATPPIFHLIPGRVKCRHGELSVWALENATASPRPAKTSRAVGND
jgi:hypothetical protein